ncbi:hypothetical protein AKJ09_08989 [Labilithrix luteola]|uniref:Regulatory protein RecX n=1 Tax=Labilithrix luteola TaxID=1391654 RepID=A0A0K1Q960_9BACT|nr:hypothetical protein AKJ09_08989 [Labilithrix luteola]
MKRLMRLGYSRRAAERWLARREEDIAARIVRRPGKPAGRTRPR